MRISSLELLPHTETGEVDCGDSNFWNISTHPQLINTKTVNFSAPYITTPRVLLSISHLKRVNQNRLFTDYFVQVDNVDTLGFDIQCGTKTETPYRILEMVVNWISVRG